MLIDCGQRLGKLSLTQFSKATAKYDLGNCLKATPIQAGLFGQNVRLETQQGNWIFRGCPHYTWQFPKEKFFANLIADKTGLPTPLPYTVDIEREHFDYDFVLMPEMPGLQLSDEGAFEALPNADKKSIATCLGSTLRKLQNYKAPFYGEFDEEADEVLEYKTSYAQQLVHRLENLIAASNVARETISSDEANDLLELFHTHAEQVDDTAPVITLQDYKDGNICVSKIGNTWKVTGIFDLMEARFGHPLEDVPRQYASYVNRGKPDLADEFLKGYRLEPADITLINCFTILDRLLVWEYFARNDDSWKEQTFSKWLERYLI